MRTRWFTGFVLLALFLSACHSPTSDARHMVRRAEQLADSLPDSTVCLIDSVLRMPVSFSERERMDMALLQGEALFRDVPLDDDFEDSAYRVATSPELERAADYYARKKRYAKAAHAALYSGYVQQHYNEKEVAMRSYKAAEQYGLLSDDSLTVARAEYRLGKLLLYEGRHQEVLKALKSAYNHTEKQSINRAAIENSIATVHVLLGQTDSAEYFLQRSLACAANESAAKLKSKVLNNFAVLYRLQGKYDQAINYLQQLDRLCLKDQEKAMLCLNFGKIFAALGNVDSVTFYFQRLESLLELANVKEETKVSGYEALLRFARSQGCDSLLLKYHEKHKDALCEVMYQHQGQAIYHIQKQYDYETLQNAMNHKLMRRHRIIILISIVAILGLIAFALSRVRLAKIRKQEAEAKTSLFHFMQQNRELLDRQKENEKMRADLLQQQSDKEIVYQELMSENHTYKEVYQEYAKKYSVAENKELETIVKLAVFLKNKGEKAFLDNLKHTVFNDESPWDAVYTVFDNLYPNVRDNFGKQHPELTEMERKDFILSFFKVSRDEEAAMLDTTIHTVDKLRNSVRKKCGKPKSKVEE